MKLGLSKGRRAAGAAGRLAALSGLTVAALGAASAAQAHHSAAMFDASKTVTITGAVKDFKWQNPHVYIEVVSTDGAGAQTVWNVECSTPNILVRRGWSIHSLKASDMVTILGHPLRDGGLAASALNVTTASGEVLKDHDYF